MSTARKRGFSIDAFRALPEVEPPFEFYGGRVIQKMSPRLPHSLIQGELLGALNRHARPLRLGRAYPELRCIFGGTAHIFDLSFFARDRQPDPRNPRDRDEILIPPDLAVEILSPGQTVGELARKLRSVIRRGVRLGWLIDDRKRAVRVFRPNPEPVILRPGDVLDGGDVLPGFALPVAELFGWLDED